MILTGNEIKQRLGTDIFIEDFDEKQLGPNSYNLRLADELVVYTDPILDVKKKPSTETIMLPDSGFLLQPGRLYLGQTIERTKTLNLVPMLVGRSSVGRLGLAIHVTAGFGDIGFDGNWTLEMCCVMPLRIYPGMEICQIYYHTVKGIIDSEYNGKYQNQKKPTPSRISQELTRH